MPQFTQLSGVKRNIFKLRKKIIFFFSPKSEFCQARRRVLRIVFYIFKFPKWFFSECFLRPPPAPPKKKCLFTEKITLLTQQNVLLIQPQQTRIVGVTILLVTVTNVVVVSIHKVVVTIEIDTQQFWSAEAILQNGLLREQRPFPRVLHRGTVPRNTQVEQDCSNRLQERRRVSTLATTPWSP